MMVSIGLTAFLDNSRFDICISRFDICISMSN